MAPRKHNATVTENGPKKAAEASPLSSTPWDRLQQVLDYQASRVRRNKYPSKMKTTVSMRIDNDVITHFKSLGDDWRGRMNEALREVAGLDREVENGD